ncbi:MAG TPA: FtsX-like permease family protein [Acidimicrobiales bacterium]|nr:FtsX-like permease family protein [Acidimicrobiales bacterium]
MNGEAVRVARYRFGATFGRRWPGYLSLALLIGLVGGLSMGSIAGARRTDSSFTVFWISTNPSDLIGATGILNPTLPLTPYDGPLVSKISRLPHVKSVETQSGINILPLQPDGAPEQNVTQFSPGPGNGYGSVDGLYFDQDKVTVTAGRMADPADPDEFMLTAQQAQSMGLHIGDKVRFGVYTNAQIQLADFGSARVRPYRVVDAKLVGIALFNTTVVEDQSDEGSSPDNLFTPALTRPLLRCCVNYSESGVQLSSPRFVSSVISEIAPLYPKGTPSFQAVAPIVLPKAQRSIEPDALALGVFGGIVALACLLIAAQLIGRQIRLGADEREALRSLGASPGQIWADGLIGIVGSVVSGGLLAVVVAVGLSPVAPIGPVRPVYPGLGVNFDWTVLGLGLLVLVLALSVISAAISFRAMPHRRSADDVASEQRPSRLLAAAAAARLPAPALTGVRFALVPGSGRTAVPVRSAVLGAVMAVIVLVGTATFGASLGALVSHPSLYGWNWDYMLSAGGDLPQQKVTALLDHDRYVASWSGVYSATLLVDDQEVPVLGEVPGTTVAPPLLSGHNVQTAGQVVLGPLTLKQLGQHLGGTVEVSSGGAPPERLRIVGTATLPAIGQGGLHLEMGVGAVLSSKLLPELDLNQFDSPFPGPQAALVRLRPHVDRAAAYRSLEQIAQETTNPENFGVGVIGVQRPAEILNYRSLGSTPVYLGAGLATGAVVALALTLIASVRRRRRDLALFKTLGFTERQLAATVAWHATTAVAIGVALGVPLGIAIGRWLWELFAQEINAVPSPTVPVLQVVLMALGALVLANIVAAVPGRLAARTPTALVLRAE